MIHRTTVEAVFLDHSYCAPINLAKVLEKTKACFIMTDNGETLSWERDMGIEFDPPSFDNPQPSSSLSPCHSVDSGFDNEMNLLTELNLDAYLNHLEEGKDFDPGLKLEDLFGDEVEKSAMNKTSKETTTKKIATSTSSTQDPSTSTSTGTKRWKVSPRQRAMMEGPVDEAVKNRKNAEAARENRLKKKKYVESLENENKELKKENVMLKTKDKNQSKTVEKLENEVAYLKNVIANQSTLSALLKSVVSTPGISFTSSFATQESEPKSVPTIDDDDDDDKADDDDDDDGHTRRYKTRSRKRSLAATTTTTPTKKPRRDVKGGVCLHVNQDKVSLEFCQDCSLKAHGNGHE